MGATVCRGCQGEVAYGAPWWANLGAVLVGLWTAAITISFSGVVAFGVGVVLAIFLLFLVNSVFRNRIVIKRVYRTRQ